MTASQLIYAFLNPDGRSDRRGLLMAAVWLLCLQAFAVTALMAFDLPPLGAVAIACHIAFVWIAFVAASKRLHDLGLSAWWIGKGLAATVVSTVILAAILMCVMDQAAFETGQDGYFLVVGGNILPVFAMTLWLHVQRGMSGGNIYGPLPGASGFSMPGLSHTSPLPAAVR